MKHAKLLVLSLSCITLLSGCGKEKDNAVVDTLVEPSSIQETTEDTVNIIKPLPSTIDIKNITDCELHAELGNKDIFIHEDSNKLIMKVDLYEQELYDMVDISLLKVEDNIEIEGNIIEIHSLETTDLGAVLINGGLDDGGYELITDENTVYYSIGYSDVKNYRHLGKVELEVSDDFLFYDNSDLDKDAVIYNVENFLNYDESLDYSGNKHNTILRISDGKVLSMTRSYTP